METEARRLALAREEIIKRDIAERIVSGKFHGGFTSLTTRARNYSMGAASLYDKANSLKICAGEDVEPVAGGASGADALCRAQALRV